MEFYSDLSSILHIESSFIDISIRNSARYVIILIQGDTGTKNEENYFTFHWADLKLNMLYEFVSSLKHRICNSIEEKRGFTSQQILHLWYTHQSHWFDVSQCCYSHINFLVSFVIHNKACKLLLLFSASYFIPHRWCLSHIALLLTQTCKWIFFATHLKTHAVHFMLGYEQLGKVKRKSVCRPSLDRFQVPEPCLCLCFYFI